MIQYHRERGYGIIVELFINTYPGGTVLLGKGLLERHDVVVLGMNRPVIMSVHPLHNNVTNGALMK